jgi:hypothetical protein
LLNFSSSIFAPFFEMNSVDQFDHPPPPPPSPSIEQPPNANANGTLLLTSAEQQQKQQDSSKSCYELDALFTGLNHFFRDEDILKESEHSSGLVSWVEICRRKNKNEFPRVYSKNSFFSLRPIYKCPLAVLLFLPGITALKKPSPFLGHENSTRSYNIFPWNNFRHRSNSPQ